MLGEVWQYIQKGVDMIFIVCCLFDYIVVGVGFVGCVLVNCFFVDFVVLVCLVEVGFSDCMLFFVVYICMLVGIICLIVNLKWNWMYCFVVQFGIVNQLIVCLCGKVWGGFSVINGMIYICGDCYDYDCWVFFGNCGWSYDELLLYFCCLEYFELGELFWYGCGGELNVVVQCSLGLINQVFFQVVEEMGWLYNVDFNGECQEGIGLFYVIQVNGECCSVVCVFLYLVLVWFNFIVFSLVLILCVLLEGICVIGVEISQVGEVV